MNRKKNKEIQDLISWENWKSQDIHDLILLAEKIKNNPSSYANTLMGHFMFMIFQKTSTRTRVSFEIGMTEMGGKAVYLDWDKTNFQLTPIQYETAYLSSHSSVIVARMKKHEDLLKLREGAEVPVINGCCNIYHPCQALADMFTIYEDRGSIKGVKLLYVGVYNNVVNSLVELACIFGVHLHLVCPICPKEVVDNKMREKLKENGLLTESLDLKQAIKDADYIYTDTWIDMEFFGQKQYKDLQEERVKIMLPYQVNQEVLQNTNAKILHDMPIHLNYEITKEVVESPRSLILKQASNRLHVQKAILDFLI